MAAYIVQLVKLSEWIYIALFYYQGLGSKQKENFVRDLKILKQRENITLILLFWLALFLPNPLSVGVHPGLASFKLLMLKHPS